MALSIHESHGTCTSSGETIHWHQIDVIDPSQPCPTDPEVAQINDPQIVVSTWWHDEDYETPYEAMYAKRLAWAHMQIIARS